MNNYSDKVQDPTRLGCDLTALLINIGSKKYQLMTHLNPALLCYCPNSGISCHAIIFYTCHHILHINFRFIKAKTYFGKKKKYFQVKIIEVTKDPFYCCKLLTISSLH